MSDLLQEDRGLIEVHKACIEMQAIWRPTPCHDLGVDGQIEFLEIADNVISTGKIIAIQVKSGPSYFKEQTKTHVKYYPSKKHRRYWQALNLPIILVLHNPDTNQTIYAEVKAQLDSGTSVLVPLKHQFNQSARTDTLSLCAHIDDPQQILRKLKSVTLITEPGKQISGIEFLLACLNPAHEYFELRMARILTMLELSTEEGGIYIGNDIYDFVHRCSLICLGAKISESFAETYDHQWYDLHQVPDFVVPLTPFGTRAADCLIENSNELVSATSFLRHKQSDARNTALYIERICQKESEKMDDWNKDLLW
ncbi:MAG: DUF4365 domain-containing protein [Cyanobacteria bacterium J06635_15]